MLPNEPSRTAGKRKHYETGVGQAASEADAKRTSAVVSKMFPESGRSHSTTINRNVAAKVTKLQTEATNARGGGGGAKPKGKVGGPKGQKAKKR